MKIRIPKEFRQGGPLRKVNPGLDLPCSFLDNIRAIDPKIYPIFHPYRVNWDDTQNQYTGDLEDPRYHIGYYPGFSEELWGWPLKDRFDNPIPEPAWHLWRLSQVGWHHIIRIESTESKYLHILVERLHLQALYRDRYGNKAWNKKMKEDEEAQKEKEASQRADELNEINKANRGLITSAREELERGNFAPTNPTKEIITSYSGQKNHTKIIRPLTDEEGGLIIH